MVSFPEWCKALGRTLLRLLRRVLVGSSDFRTMFGHFRTVLDCNSKSLETITDMGEKLGAEYIFDVNYTKNAYNTLSEHITCALASFNLLTNDRYPRLAEVRDRIDALVQRMFMDAGPVSERLAVFYEDITWDLAEEVGGKNYHLAELQNNLQLRAPMAFAITTAAFDLFVRHNKLSDRIATLTKNNADDAGLAALRTAVLKGSLPDSFLNALAEALKKIRSRQGRDCRLAVRSSAEEEDGDFSFAGQFETVLNVACTAAAVQKAYKEVLASLFQSGAAAYQRHLGYAPGRLKMAVGCVAMVDARMSGVIHTASGSNREVILINAAWGLGRAVVDGLTDADLYTLHKGGELQIIDLKKGRKEKMVIYGQDGETEIVDTPAAQRDQACLTEAQVLDLGRQAVMIEDYFKTPQDIAWAIDGKGRCYILQARTLRVMSEDPAPTSESAALQADQPVMPVPAQHPVLLRNQGVVVQQGTTAGRVFILRHADRLDNVPKGAVLVAANDSSHFVRIIPFLHAIITDTGAATSHMATICREFNLPTVVNTGNATQLLMHGQEITLQAGDDEVVIFQGTVPELLRQHRQTAFKMRELYEFRRQKYIMRFIAPLRLVNPLEEEFVPEACRTMHDLIRFMHEKSVQELITKATGAGKRGLRNFFHKQALHQLSLPIPVQILVIDIGEGLKAARERVIGLDQVTSLPLRAILNGMIHPGVWHAEGMALHGKDLLAGMTRAADLANDVFGMAGTNLAVASREYLNLSLKFGYHFNVLDCFCSDQPRTNHIYFRFVGGAATLTSRSRRINLMAAVLVEYGFLVKTRGDLLIARLSNLERRQIENTLDQVGRLIAYARQLDAVLDADETVARLVKNFLAGSYDVD